MVTGARRADQDPGQDPDQGPVPGDSRVLVPAISPTPGPDAGRTPVVPARGPTRRPRPCRRRGTRGIRRAGARTRRSRTAVARSRRSRARPGRR
ncbi:hypothetical protein GCM10018793_63570 [Streptomyces sulfonofaciens]|uniref:Uncharacterized protein n=1 Tax=Streptomyces sulfonofaciens TaxID=68272 RepID=A0A919GPJ3_9ACTN|nr:hypothetical protein GCM10018793_63570 [Streptomyces sulfonofaciens]